MSIVQYIGDCREVLRTLPDASVHCVVTSPPYWRLRDYGTATWQGGDPGCEHVKGTAASQHSTLKNDGRKNFGSNNYEHSIVVPFREQCGHCGAIRIDAQLGLEPDFNAYVAAMVSVFREVRRVLRDDGTLWLNLGDSYASQGGYRDYGSHDNYVGRGPTGGQRPSPSVGLKPKDLCGIPWRVAFALQADGWYLRQDIIWSKPNPMPESVTDRCTKAHEYLFLLSKRERYYYDAAAIAEKPVTPIDGRGSTQERKELGHPTRYGNTATKAARGDGWSMPSISAPEVGRNKRSVWEVTTAPFSEAHFATFPPALIEPCIKAGCSRDGTVLDPFAGAGTTGLVADRLQRNAVLIELNPTYAAMGKNRITDDAPLFVQLT